MAITITTDFTVNELLTTGNDWSIVFESDNVESPTHATVVYESKTFTIDPDPNDKFTYNFKDSINRIINASNYADNIDLDISGGSPEYVKGTEGDYYKNTSVEISVFFEVAATETTSHNFRFKKGVYNLKDYKIGDVTREPIFDVLAPKFDGEYYMLATSGQPFDISCYKRDEGSAQVENLTTSGSVNPTFLEGVTRLVLNDGEGNVYTTIALQDGWNKLRITAAGVAEPFDINVYQTNETCRKVIKWFSSEGGWLYFPFEHVSYGEATKIIDQVDRSHENLKTVEQPYQVTGYSKVGSMEVTSIQVSKELTQLFKSLISSLMVYEMERHLDTDAVIWLPTRHKGGALTPSETGKNFFDFQISFYEPEPALVL